MRRSPSLLFALAAVAALSSSLPAQRGRNRRSEAILERISVYLVDAALPAKSDKTAGDDRFAALPVVTAARAKNELVLLYLYDTSADVPKREQFEAAMFANEELSVSLRCFHTLRVDIAADPEAKAKYGRRVPVFLAYDEHGKLAGDVALTGFKAATADVITLLGKAAAGHVKPTLATFVADYRGLVHDLEVQEQQKKTLQDRIAKLDDDKKKAALQKDLEQLDANGVKLAATEKDLLEHARLPARAEGAKRYEKKDGER